MIARLKKEIQKYTISANNEGRLLGAKALEKYLTKSELTDITQKKLADIMLGDDAFIKRRLRLSTMELARDTNILKADVRIFKAQGKIAGFTDKQTLSQLVLAGKEQEGAAQELARRLKRINITATRNARTAGELKSYLKIFPGKTPYQWIAISVKPCQDCSIRAGKVKTYEEWLTKYGIPNSGRTICNRWGAFCRCKLVPLPIAEKQFPTIKDFEFTPKTGVLTTARELRAFKAKKSQPPQRKKK